MIVYFDTSALVKRYVAEPDSAAVLDLWERTVLIAASQLLYAEMSATLARKRREQPGSAPLLDQAERAFRDDWPTLYRIPVDDEINRRVDDLLTRHALRGADAVHLASALLLRHLAEDTVHFACADAALVDAAGAEGLQTQPPT